MLVVFFIACFILSIFILYVLIKHDFIIARKSLLLQEIFDATLAAYVAFILSSRILYIISMQRFDLLNPIKFFHILRFPGALFLGGVFGFGFVIYLIFRKKKILSRLFDIYSLSMLPLFIFVLVFSFNKGYFLYFNILIFLLSLLFMGIGVHTYKNYTLKDGSTAFLFVCLVTVYTIVSEFSSTNRFVFSFFTVSQILSIMMFVAFSILLLIREGLLGGKKSK